MPHIFSGLTIDKVAADALLFIMDPPRGWANLTDCVEFPCTAPENLLLQFRDSIHFATGTTIAELPSSVPFDIISDNPGYNGAFSHCTKSTNWNANVCTGDDMALLVFESLDPDKYDRSVQPVYITQEDVANLRIKLNSFMDHVWDGFYTGQTRLLRFPAVVQSNIAKFHII